MYNRQDKQLSWVCFLAIEMQGTHTITVNYSNSCKITEICTTALPALPFMESKVSVGL